MVSAAHIAALLAVASGVAAQGGLEQCASLTTLFPACATGCILSAASAVGCTNGLDLRCRCDPTSSAQIQASAFNCVIGNCNADPTQIESAINAGASVCGCVNAAPTAVPSEPPITSAPAPSSPPVPSEPEPSEPPSSGPPPSAPSSEVVSEEPSVPPVIPSSTEPASSGPITPAPSSPGDGDCDATSPCEDIAQAVPNCGRSCIISAASASLGCAAEDYECQCAGFQTIQAGAAPCVISACDIAGAVPLLGSVSALCGCVTANPSTPCTASSEPSITVEPSAPASSGSGGEPPVEPSSEAPGPGESSEAPGPSVIPPPTTCAPPTAPDCGPVATSAVPACAQHCFLDAAPNVGCDATDYACQCEAEAQASLTQLLVPCVATACPPASLQAVITGASSVCACAAAIPTGTGEDDCPGGSGIPQPSGKPTTTKDDYPAPGGPTPYPLPPHASETPCPEPEEPGHPGYPAPEPEHPAPEPEHPASEPEHPVPEPETPAPEPETPAPEPETPAPEPETPAPEPETPAPVPETPEAPAPVPTQVDNGDDDEPVTVPVGAAARSDLSIMGSLLVAVLLAAGLM
ncbi:uncharacterized protein VDAG_03583 [Verticillium dahliae VdLs.17]|uniref:CFEM domain-containing protein n=1 Tax=Verticillium dahliae (strain VdLs.17 / ATCC MYA-4575 / FGSC 10137) TaxID=498257 RepID=G2X1H2_VERDV|nr:uncharacterized protein VDAG_03583 [Verticillium dahliae VdLs.17]EGY22145.1 hypothetical protein VDAG_03583 [Verticillium dahliae VdLs.17]